MILRLVELAFGRVDAELPEHALHAERARFVRDDGHDALADVFVARQGGEQPHEGHGGGYSALARALQLLLEGSEGRHGEVALCIHAHRDGPAKLGALAFYVDGLQGVRRRPVVRHGFQVVIREGDVEAVAEVFELV